MIRVQTNRNPFNYDWHAILKTYGDHVTKDSAVLEIGASVKSRTLELARQCKSLIGVEVMPERMPADTENIHYLCLDWEDLSSKVQPNSMDVAVASHVIEHVKHDLAAIEELYKVLTPGGVAILITPNRTRLTRWVIELFTGPRKFPYWEHEREYTEPDLTKLLEKSSFEKWDISARVFGIHGGPIFCYSDRVPERLRRRANYWEIVLYR